MTCGASPTPTLAWLRPNQAPLLAAVARLANLRLLAAGSPASEARSAPADSDGEEAFTDLRSALTTTEAGLVLLLAGPGPEAFGGGADQAPIADLEILRLCHARGAALLSLDPIPSSTNDLASLSAPGVGESSRRPPMIPLLTQSKVFADALEAIESLGQPRTVSLSFWSGAGEGSLGARLFDAVLVIHTLLGAPESIDATVVTRVAASGVRMAPGETLRDLRGDLTANLRFPGAKAACLTLSDRGGPWRRGVSIVTDAGRIRLDEEGFEHIDAGGATIDSTAPAGESPRPGPRAAPAIASAIVRALDPHAPRSAPIDLPSVLATCEAALLSARTGQPESPVTILRMNQAR